MTLPRILLSPPHLSGDERALVAEVFDTNWIAPAGPMVTRFEAALAATTGHAAVAALSSGTAAMQLALRLLGVGPGDEVWTATLTFIGGVTPIVFQGATPVFLDVSPETWTLDPALLEAALAEAERVGRLPKVVVPVDLYGQAADLDAVLALCRPRGIAVVTDSAESVGSTYKGMAAGKGADLAVYSFNGNKIVTTGGGGALAGDDPALIDRARWLSQQAREPAPHYEHETIGYNYRMPSLSAAVGVGQLALLPDRVSRRRAIFARYRAGLADLPGIAFMPEAPTGIGNRWLTVILLDSAAGAPAPEALRRALDAAGIEARPVWKPMHMQPVFSGSRRQGGTVAERLFATGLCLPSGTGMPTADQDRVIEAIRKAWAPA